MSRSRETLRAQAARLAPAGGVGDLDVDDVSCVAVDRQGNIVTVVGEVEEVGEQADVVNAPLIADALNDRHRVGGGPQRVGLGAADGQGIEPAHHGDRRR